MSIGRGELADWLKALRDFVDHYDPHLLYFPSPTTDHGKSVEMRKRRLGEGEQDRGKEEEER